MQYRTYQIYKLQPFTSNEHNFLRENSWIAVFLCVRIRSFSSLFCSFALISVCIVLLFSHFANEGLFVSRFASHFSECTCQCLWLCFVSSIYFDLILSAVFNLFVIKISGIWNENWTSVYVLGKCEFSRLHILASIAIRIWTMIYSSCFWSNSMREHFANIYRHTLLQIIVIQCTTVRMIAWNIPKKKKKGANKKTRNDDDYKDTEKKKKRKNLAMETYKTNNRWLCVNVNSLQIHKFLVIFFCSE